MPEVTQLLPFEARPVLGRPWVWQVWDVEHPSECNHFPVITVDSKGASDDFHKEYARICADALNARRRLASPPAPTAERSQEREIVAETFETIRQWCDETFGPATPAQIVQRAAEEFEELEGEVARDDPDRLAIEAADVVICLCRMPGFDEALQRKMGINRKRKWRLTGNGTGYHIPEHRTTATPSEEPPARPNPPHRSGGGRLP